MRIRGQPHGALASRLHGLRRGGVSPLAAVALVLFLAAPLFVAVYLYRAAGRATVNA